MKSQSKQPSLQEAFDELEAITQTLERGEGDLENSIPLLKKGHELATYLTEKLNSLEQEITEISAKQAPLVPQASQAPQAPAQSSSSDQNDSSHDLPF